MISISIYFSACNTSLHAVAKFTDKEQNQLNQIIIFIVFPFCDIRTRGFPILLCRHTWNKYLIVAALLCSSKMIIHQIHSPTTHIVCSSLSKQMLQSHIIAYTTYKITLHSYCSKKLCDSHNLCYNSK